MFSLSTNSVRTRALGITFIAGVTLPLCSGAAFAAPADSHLTPSFPYYSGETSSAAYVLKPVKTSPQITVPESAVWEFEAPEIVVVANPEPEPEPEPVVERTPSTSRSAERQTPEEENDAPPVSVASGSVIDVAASLVGIPYVYGGTTTSGFDCSGFTQFVYAKVGVSLPRTSSAQGSAGVAVSKAEGQPGDLVYMPGHVGIYAGNGKMYDAPRPGKNVQLRDIWTEDYQLRRVM